MNRTNLRAKTFLAMTLLFAAGPVVPSKEREAAGKSEIMLRLIAIEATEPALKALGIRLDDRGGGPVAPDALPDKAEFLDRVAKQSGVRFASYLVERMVDGESRRVRETEKAQYMQPVGDRLFELREAGEIGLDATLLATLLSEEEIRVSLDCTFKSFSERLAVKDVNLDIGIPIISVHQASTQLICPNGAVVTPASLNQSGSSSGTTATVVLLSATLWPPNEKRVK